MGSEEAYLTVEETAKQLAVHPSQIHAWNRAGWLEAHYPNGRLGGKRFRPEDIQDFQELRGLEKSGLRCKLPQLAMKAIVTSRRAERRIEEIANYLGLDAPALSPDKEDVVLMYMKLQSFCARPSIKDQQEAIEMAKSLLGITEEYLSLVEQYTGDKEPWQLYTEVAKALAGQCSPGTDARGFAEHARRNLRNVAYFYLRSTRGAREAGKIFPGENYSSKLVRTLFPC